MTAEQIDEPTTPQENPSLTVLAQLRVDWDQFRLLALDLLKGFVSGDDLSEPTPKALYYFIPLFAEKAETDTFADLCALGSKPDLLLSALGDDSTFLTYPAALTSTFGGDPTPLVALIESESAHDSVRGDAILVLAYLTAVGKFPERRAYDILAVLPERLDSQSGWAIWSSYASAVAWLGFTGLSFAVEAAFERGQISGLDLTSAQFWSELRAIQQQGRDPDAEYWARFQPIEDAVRYLELIDETMELYDAVLEQSLTLLRPALEPIRNPFRSVGRNDHCPCGSGKKYKKCCLTAA